MAFVATQPAWRLDPKESLTDWTIIISSKESRECEDASDMEVSQVDDESISDTYHVHKYVLAAGPRASSYFKRLFSNSGTTVGLKETQTSTSNIELERSAAEAFPVMLDFMYAMNTTGVAATTQNGVALRYLANYFDIPTLLDNVTKFIHADMDISNIHVYAEEANLYEDEEIIQSTMKPASLGWRSSWARKEYYMTLLSDNSKISLLQLSLKHANSDVQDFERRLATCQRNLSQSQRDSENYKKKYANLQTRYNCLQSRSS